MHTGSHPQLSLLAKVLWVVIAGILLAPLVIALVGGHVPAPEPLRGLPPFSSH
jgi:hypothetical protein